MLEHGGLFETDGSQAQELLVESGVGLLHVNHLQDKGRENISVILYTHNSQEGAEYPF